MPNHVYSQMKVSGDAITIKEFAEKHFENGTLSLGSFSPMPKELIGKSFVGEPPNQVLIKKYGVDNWYDWAIKNWGTKWDAYDGDMDVVIDTEIISSFTTAWNLPIPIFKKIAEMYPNLKVEIRAVEEGDLFGGIINIDNGIVTKEIWKKFSEEEL